MIANLLKDGDDNMATSKNKFKVEWTGKYPRLYLGEWHIYKNGKLVDQFLPTNLRTIPAFTYGEYPVWEENPFASVQQFVTDGYEIPEWIQKNLFWLQLIADEDEDYRDIYLAFHEFDFRTSRYL